MTSSEYLVTLRRFFVHSQEKSNDIINNPQQTQWDSSRGNLGKESRSEISHMVPLSFNVERLFDKAKAPEKGKGCLVAIVSYGLS